jgi:hypothetical protein
VPFVPVLIFLALAAEPPSAAALGDLHAVLARFGAHEPIRTRFTFRFETASGEGAGLVRTEGEASGKVTESGAGLEIAWPRGVLDLAREETWRRAADPEATTPVRDAIAGVTAIDLARCLDAAAALREALDGATIVEDRQEVLHGAADRLLVLEVNPSLAARDRRYVKKVKASLRIWLGADGVPLEAEARTRVSGRVMLLATFESEERQSYRFERLGDRLVAVRHETSRRGEAFGENGERKTRIVLSFDPTGAP